MDSREKDLLVTPDADVAFEPYFSENAEMGVKLDDSAPKVEESEVVGEENVKEEKLEDVMTSEAITEDNKEDKGKKEPVKKKKKKPVDKKEAGKKPTDKKEAGKKPVDKKKAAKKPVDKKKKLKEKPPVKEGEGETVIENTVPEATDAQTKTASVKKKPATGQIKKKKKKPAGAPRPNGKPAQAKVGTGKPSAKKKSNSKKKKGSLRTLLTLSVALPILIVSAVLIINIVSSLRTNIVDTEKDGLKTTAIAVKSTFEGLAGRDTNYHDENNGSVIYQGEIKITGKDSIVEKIAENGDVQVSFVYGDKRILTSFKDANGDPMNIDGVNANNKIDPEIYKKVVEGGEEYFSTDVEMMGEKYYGFYLPIKNNEGESDEETKGLIFVGRNSDEIEKVITGATVKVVAISIVLAIISIIAAAYIASNISKMINKLAGNLAKIADGDLSINIDKKILANNNEIGMIGRASDRLKDSLNGIVGNIKESVDVLTVSAGNLETTSDRTNTTMIEVSKAVEEIADSAGVQASETEKATVNAMDMGNLIENVIQNVQELQENARVMGEAEKASSEIITELSKSNDKTIDAVERIAVQAEYTNTSAQRIKKAVALITSIADETSLLSLNASIEAARAGEAGRGFAVVASEISKLADQSNNSATEIEKIINELLIESNKTVDIMEEVKGIVSEQEEKLNMTKAEFENVSRGIESSVGSVENISGRMVELDIAKNGIIDVIQSLSAISEENAAATEETSASVQELDSTVGSLSEAAKDLKVIAEQLDQQIGVFKV